MKPRSTPEVTVAPERKLGRPSGAGSETADVNPFDYVLQEPDDSQVEPSVAADKQPPYHATTLQPHQCLSGWVNFEIPAKPKAVLLKSTDLSWLVP